jgi:Transposase DDE domain
VKLLGVCNIFGGLENIYFTSGNIHDNRVLNELLKDINGVFVCDSGYLLNEENLKKFMDLNKEFFIATRKNIYLKVLGLSVSSLSI